MRDEALASLFEKYPEAKAGMDKALGYIVVKNFAIHPGLLSFASGYGLVHDNARNRETCVDFRRLTIGPGIAVKAVYGLALFHDQELMEAFEDGKWTPFGQLEASFVFGDFGGAAECAWAFSRKLDVYYRTFGGVALEAELFGLSHVGNEEELNEPAAGAPSN
jgi:hypothetical protein